MHQPSVWASKVVSGSTCKNLNPCILVAFGIWLRQWCLRCESLQKSEILDANCIWTTRISPQESAYMLWRPLLTPYYCVSGTQRSVIGTWLCFMLVQVRNRAHLISGARSHHAQLSRLSRLTLGSCGGRHVWLWRVLRTFKCYDKRFLAWLCSISSFPQAAPGFRGDTLRGC